jgi:hypothetical protein
MQMQLYFLVTYFSWRATQFRMSFDVGKA